MQIYHYHQETGIYVGQGIADPDPLVKGSWLIPAGATVIQPADELEGFWRVFSDGKWVYQEIPKIVEPEPETQEPA